MGLRPISVLLVSEDRGLLRCLGKLLKICGCDVCPVSALAHAPAALESVSPDFLILDAQPSFEDALEISRGQSTRHTRGEIYTLLLTQSPGIDELHKALEAGIDDFLRKPIVYCEFLARLRVGARELELERRLDEQARIDPLTGLPNRRALEGRMKRQLSAGTGNNSHSVCVLMEVDFFQRVNHHFGEHASETVLRCIAAKVQELTRESAFLASLGGGRFALLPNQLADAEATAWARRLHQEWAESEILIAECRLQFTASFGVAGSEDNGPISAEDVLRRSAEALDLAKASGGDCVVRSGEFNDQDEAWSTFAAPGKLFEGACARDVMTPLPCVVRPDELASDAVGLLRRSRLAALPAVDDDGKLLGLVTENCLGQDLSNRKAANSTVGQVMKRDIRCLDAKASFTELVECFAQDAATPVVIADGGRPTGLAVPENLVLLGRKLNRESLSATVPFSPLSDYLVVPDLCPAETA